MNYVYILRCADNTLYCGWTTDLNARIAAHNSGSGAKYTRSRIPVELAYYEEYEDKHEAMSREWHIKRLSREAKIRLIAEMQVDEDLMSIPVIILTVDQKAELDCLRSGVMDFIPKPYPDIEIVKARIAKCIELSEDRVLIRYTERDKLTGLLNRDYFFRYVSRLDHLHKDSPLDAIVCDVNRFHAVNKQYGRQFGDRVLHGLGAGIRKLSRKTGGIGCREGGDSFLMYCPHQDDYEPLIREFLEDVFAEKDMADKVSVRFGVFTDAQQEQSIEERFVRAKIAADRVKDDPRKICGIYDLG